jgi:predicted phosphodiesterase
MRIAIISDIHGNLTALEAVLADLKTVAPDVILSGGDLAHGGARPAEVVDRIRELDWPGVCGNTDEMLWAPETLRVFAGKSPARFQRMFEMIGEMGSATRALLGAERIAWMSTIPREQRRGAQALVHASPGDLWRAPLPNAADSELREVYGSLQAPVAVYAHIHQPYVREMPGLTVANTGSVSLSYDGDTRASYLVVEEGKAVIRRVEYDVDAEAQALLGSGLPHSEWVCKNLRAGRFVPPE